MSFNLRTTVGLSVLLAAGAGAAQARCPYEGTRYAPMLCPVVEAQGGQGAKGGPAKPAPPKKEAFPGSVPIAEGRYFIVNAGSGQALQPVGPTAGQNVILSAFNRGDAQQWMFKRVRDVNTKQLSNRVTIQLAGPTPLYLQPVAGAGHSATIGVQRSASYSLHPAGEGYLIRNFQRDGDAMHAVAVPSANTAVHFGPSDSSTAFVWLLVPARQEKGQ